MRKAQADERTCNTLHVGFNAFGLLINILRITNLLRDFMHTCIKEQVAKFLQILVDNIRNHIIGLFFYHSVETINHHFH